MLVLTQVNELLRVGCKFVFFAIPIIHIRAAVDVLHFSSFTNIFLQPRDLRKSVNLVIENFAGLKHTSSGFLPCRICKYNLLTNKSGRSHTANLNCSIHDNVRLIVGLSSCLAEVLPAPFSCKDLNASQYE